LENNSWKNILQNTRHYRLLALTVATVVGIIIFVCRKVFFE
jgi:hypothetical protein